MHVSDRRERIQRALDQLIERRRAYDFQNIAFHIVKAAHPSLILSEWNHDGGEDAFMLPPRGGADDVSLACSLTAEQSKVLWDCRRIRERGVQPRMVIFATPRTVERTMVNKWKHAVGQEFGFELEVISRNGIVAELERPQNDWICREYLHLDVPPASDVQAVLARARENARKRVESWREVYGLDWAQLLDLRLTQPETDTSGRRDELQAERALGREQRLTDLAEELTAGRQIVLQAPGGAGKTTALLQMANHLLGKERGPVPVYVSMSEWSTLMYELESYVAEELGLQQAELRELDSAGALVFLLNGWNEVGVEQLPWARSALSHALRQLPNVCVVLTTRGDEGASPLPRPELLTVASLNDSEREQAIRNAHVEHPDEVANRLEQNRTLDALTRLPLFLRVALSVLNGSAELPLTAYGLLTAFVRRIEDGEHRDVLWNKCKGFHLEYLADIAALLTDSGATSIRPGPVVHRIGDTSKRLLGERLIGSPPDAHEVLQVLCAHHLLLGSGYRSETVSFGHPLFQAWFAARALEQMVRTGSDSSGSASIPSTTQATDDPSDSLLRRINSVPWGTATELLVEHLAEEANGTHDTSGLHAVMRAATEVDLEFACRLFGRGSEQMMKEVAPDLPAYLHALYAGPSPQEREYALAGMVATKSAQFSDVVWETLRERRAEILDFSYGRGELRLNSLGPSWPEQIQQWDEPERAVLFEALIECIVPEERSRIVSVALEDRSLVVHAHIIGALDLMGEMRMAVELLRANPELLNLSTSRALLHRLRADDIRSLEAALRTALESTADEAVRFDLLNALARAGVVSPDDMVAEAWKALAQASTGTRTYPSISLLLAMLNARSPDAVGTWVFERVVSGGEVKPEWIVYLASTPDERLVSWIDQVTDTTLGGDSAPATHRVLSRVHARVHRSEVVLGLVRNWVRVLRAARTEGQQSSEGGSTLEDLLRELEYAIREQPYELRLKGVLSFSDAPRDTSELHEVRRLLGPSSAMEPAHGKDLPAALRAQLRESVLAWEGKLREISDLSRSTRSALAVLLSEAAEPLDVVTISRWIEEDLEAWQRELSEREHGRNRGVANVSYTSWYAGSLVRLGSDAAIKALIDLLDEPLYLGAASMALASYAVGPRRHSLETMQRDWTGSGEGGNLPAAQTQRERISSAIATATESHLRQRDERSRPYAYEFGEAAEALGYLGCTVALPLVFQLSELEHCQWQLLTALEGFAAWGTALPAESTDAFIENLLERLRDPRRSSSQDPWPSRLRCYALLLQTDNPERGTAKIRSVLRTLSSYRLRDIVRLLGRSSAPSAARLLIELLRSDTVKPEHRNEIVLALSHHPDDATSAALEEELDRVYARLGSDKSWDGDLHDLHGAIATVAQTNTRLRDAVLGRAATAKSSEVRSALAALLSHLRGDDAELAACHLLTDALESHWPYEIRHLLEGATTRKEAVGGSGAYWILPKASTALRRRLLELMMADPKREGGARRALLFIEDQRVKTGRPSDEPRHPAGELPETWRRDYPVLARRPWVMATVDDTTL